MQGRNEPVGFHEDRTVIGDQQLGVTCKDSERREERKGKSELSPPGTFHSLWVKVQRQNGEQRAQLAKDL